MRSCCCPLSVLGSALVIAFATPDLSAQTCTVPGSHSTLQEAVDDPGSATVTLAAQTYPESVVLRRPVTVAGPGASDP